MIKDNQKHFNRLQVALDGLVTIVSYLISWYAMLRSVEGKAIGVLPPEFYMMVLVILVPFFLLLNYACGLYTPKRVQGRRLEGSNIVKANVIGGLGMMAAYFMLRLPDVSRLQIGLFLVLNVVLTFVERNIVRMTLMNMRRMGLNLKHILLVGYSRAAEEYIDRITQNPQWGYNVMRSRSRLACRSTTSWNGSWQCVKRKGFTRNLYRITVKLFRQNRIQRICSAWRSLISVTYRFPIRST